MTNKLNALLTNGSYFCDIIRLQLAICHDNLSMSKRFRDRAEAGQQLAHKLLNYARTPQAIVLALPRGGVPVAAPIAATLQLPLDLCLVRKLGVPSNPELAMGAIDLQGRRYLNEEIIAEFKISPASIDRVAELEAIELARRERLYRGNRPPLNLTDRIVILVDDGLATGATMRSAVRSIQPQQPAQIIVAVPISAPAIVAEFTALVDLVVCPIVPQSLYAIGAWYDNFPQISDAEVGSLLTRSRFEA
jgi:putative phosphoribosyl transferase